MEMLKERLKRLGPVVRYYQKKYQDETCCATCGLPWSVAKPHFVTAAQESENVSWGFFTDCEYCWPKLSIEKRQIHAYVQYCRWPSTKYTLDDMMDGLAQELQEKDDLREES